MAEGWAKHLHPELFEVYSAGIETHGLNPNAVKVMHEAGVDITNHQSTHFNQYSDINFDYVITVCGHADEHCPVFPGQTRVIHQGFDDPPKLAETETTEEAKLDHYRRVRDQIKQYVNTLPSRLNNE